MIHDEIEMMCVCLVVEVTVCSDEMVLAIEGVSAPSSPRSSSREGWRATDGGPRVRKWTFQPMKDEQMYCCMAEERQWAAGDLEG